MNTAVETRKPRPISPFRLFGVAKCVRDLGPEEAVERLRLMLPNGHEADGPVMTREEAEKALRTGVYPREVRERYAQEGAE